MSCHARGINPKDDQIRDHVAKNPKSFKRTDAEIIRALYVPKEKMRALMDEDAERFRKALEKTGNKVSPSEPVMNATLRYEADVDLPTLAAEIGLTPEELQARIVHSEVLSKSFGPLKSAGGTVPRQVVAQAFGDLVRDLRLGAVFQPGQTGETLPDNTGEVDPLEAQSSPANAVAFSPDGRWAAFASADKSVVIWGVEENRELRRCIGHTASVWCVAFSPDGSRLLSGGKDGTVRLWETRTARELHQFTGHEDLVTCVAFGPSGRWALSAGYDHQVIRWDLETGAADPNFTFDAPAKYINAVAVSPDGDRCLVCAEQNVYVADAKTGKVLRTFSGHTDSVTAAAFSADGKRVLSGGDDRDAAAVGGRHRQANPGLPRPRGRRQERGLLAGRPARPVRLGRRDGAAVGRGDRQGPARLPQARRIRRRCDVPRRGPGDAVGQPRRRRAASGGWRNRRLRRRRIRTTRRS